MAATNPKSLKQYLYTLADNLPDTATTDEALYNLVLRCEIQDGLADSDAGRSVPMEAVMRRYGLNVGALTSAIGLRRG